jgi:magnesium-transporting ATPase (P-type)
VPKHPDASQRKQNKSLRRLTRSLGTSLWPLMRQQVFLGMPASSVPVKQEVPQLMEDLTAAGVRFVYFSPRNMRRSKPVAEKIGIQFDWNCAISLRELSTEHDPHRYISNYADWDVHARLPHGVPEIKRHLREVDNVPLLVSLYTDSTPATTQQMVEVFRSYGEVVLTVGSAYRASNSGIFQAANMAVSVNMLPGDQGHLHIHADSVIRGFPEVSDHGLARADLMLVFRLVSLGAVHLLQTPPTICSMLPSEFNGTKADPSTVAEPDLEAAQKKGVERVLPGISMSGAGPQLRMEALLEAVRKGRVLLLNMLQAIAMMCVSVFSLALWPLASVMLPVAVPPSISPAIAQLFLFVHVPFLLLGIINAPAPKNVLKSTPRKNIFNLSTKDEKRFTKYLLCRAGYTTLSVYVIGWVSIASVANPGGSWYKHMLERTDLLSESRGEAGVKAFSMVQDVMSIQLLLSLVMQALTLLERGQTWERLAFPSFHGHPTLYLCILFVCSLHAVAMGIRAWMRDGFQEYRNLDYAVWLVLIVATLGTFFVGLAVNAHDEKRHRRLMQFLRLDFDTKLGMHSPR